MSEMDIIIKTIALTMGVAWASGINLYAAILVLGLLGSTGNVVLPPELQILTHPAIIGAAGLMYAVEFFADKIPGIDNTWDTIHTFIRIPAGAILAAGAVGPVNPALTVAVAILGGGLAAGSHATKAGSRILINASPEAGTNRLVSVTEDAVVVAGLWTAFYYPWLFLFLLFAFLGFMIWLLPKIWKGIKKVFGFLGSLLGRKEAAVEEPEKGPDEAR